MPSALYIFWILHQTTTLRSRWPSIVRCISFESYIKPQLVRPKIFYYLVVYLLNPTSNHNCGVLRSPGAPLYIFWILHQTTTLVVLARLSLGCISFESYIKPQRMARRARPLLVVYLLNPTSNHNWLLPYPCIPELYIFWILHQTTTLLNWNSLCFGCISFESYIKPQPRWFLAPSS